MTCSLRYKRRTVVAAVIAVSVLIGIALVIFSPGRAGLPASVPGATFDVTANYSGYDFGITPTVKRYGNAVFDIDKIRDTIVEEGAITVETGGSQRRIELEKTDTVFSGTLPGFTSYTGTGDNRFSQHISIGDKSLLLWIKIDGVSYYIDTTSVEDENGRLVHYIYSSRDVGWSDEHRSMSGYTLTPVYLGDNVTDESYDIYEFSEADLSRFPVSGRFLKYGAKNLELTNKEAGDISANFRGKAVCYNDRCYSLIYMTA